LNKRTGVISLSLIFYLTSDEESSGNDDCGSQRNN
jgi:hypothetical protein